MSYVIVACGYAAGHPCRFVGQYLEWYDPDIPDDTKVMATWTDDITKAKIFADPAACFEEWTRVRTLDSIRPDGQPNKPLTAITIEMRLV